jgi:hypothetical protein
VAVDLIQLQFSRSDGTLWRTKALAPYPQNPSPFGQSDSYRGVNGIGSHTNVYNGKTYSIDPGTDMLLTNGVPVGQLHWRIIGTNYIRIDVITHYGFAVDYRGRGWLATAENDGDPQYYLFMVNLETSEVFYIDAIGNAMTDPEAGLPVNGLVVVPLPPLLLRWTEEPIEN